ncbi:MAG: hypothetical protein MJY47_04805 [Fibrobacter sp.]|nr:hypothetical protein [Fibrobacter sp.]
MAEENIGNKENLKFLKEAEIKVKDSVLKTASDVREAFKIDFKKYSTPEIADNIANVLAPQTGMVRIVKWGGVFIVLGIITDVILCNVSNQQAFVTILAAIFVFFMVTFSGLLFGTNSFFKLMNRSIQGILDFSNDTIHQIIEDIQHFFETLKLAVDGCRIKLPGGHEIVSGVLIEIVNPAAKTCFENKLPFKVVGKLFFKVYLIAIKGLLKISSVFFAKIDKQIDKMVNDQLAKVKNVAKSPLDVVENTIGVWKPKIIDGTNTYIGKAKNYIHRTFFLASLPMLFFAITFIVATITLVYFSL